jgi:hypothetical protein
VAPHGHAPQDNGLDQSRVGHAASSPEYCVRQSKAADFSFGWRAQVFPTALVPYGIEYATQHEQLIGSENHVVVVG